MNQLTLNINYHSSIIHTNYEQFATGKRKDVYTCNIKPDFKENGSTIPENKKTRDYYTIVLQQGRSTMS